jgi:hypothetical protein
VATIGGLGTRLKVVTAKLWGNEMTKLGWMPSLQKRPRLSVFTALKNGVTLGYPFVESILSLLPICDEYIVLEGHSDDDTLYWLERLRDRYPDKIKIHRSPWPQGLEGGSSIAVMQDRALQLCRGKWAYLQQADEIMPPENLRYLQKLIAPRTPLERVIGRRRFNSYTIDLMHVMDNFQRVATRYCATPDHPQGLRWSLRLVRLRPWARRFISSAGDGWSLKGLGCSLIGTAQLPMPVVHVGHEFPINRVRKAISHASLYPEVERIEMMQRQIRDHEENLRRYEDEGNAALSRENPLQLPPILEPLIGQMEYRVREELFMD